MGWRPPPEDPEFGADCDRFEAGKTPYAFIASFSGIELCTDIWPPGAVPPPMSFELTQAGYDRCLWGWARGDWQCAFSLSNPGKSVLNFTYLNVIYIFESELDGLVYGFESDITVCEIDLFLGKFGSAHVIPRTVDEGPTLTKMCLLADVPADVDTKCDFVPLDADTGWCRFFRNDLQIKAKIKYTLADLI